jgi:hypothetical protein
MVKKSEFEDLEKQTYEVDVKTEDIQPSKRRTEFETLYTIFKAVEIEGKIYHILERTGVSFNRWKKYNLAKRGFIEKKGLSKIYVLKEKARKFIEEFDGIIKLGVLPEENIKLREIHKKPPRQIPSYEIEWREKLQELGEINFGIFVHVIASLSGSHISRPFYSVPIDEHYKIHIRRGDSPRIVIYNRPSPESGYRRYKSKDLPSDIIDLVTRKLQEIGSESSKPIHQTYELLHKPPRQFPLYEIEWKKMLQQLGRISTKRFKRSIKYIKDSGIRHSSYLVPIDEHYKIHIRRGKVPVITIHHRSSVESIYQQVDSVDLPPNIIDLITRRLLEIESESSKITYSLPKKPRQIPSYEIEWKKMLQQLGEIGHDKFIRIINFLNGSKIRRYYYSLPLDDNYEMHIRRGRNSKITIHCRPSVESDYQQVDSENLPPNIIDIITRELQEIESESSKPSYRFPKKPRQFPLYEIEWKEMLQQLGEISVRRFKRIIKFLNGSRTGGSFYLVPIDDRYKMHIRRGIVPRITIHHRPSTDSNYEPINSEDLQPEIIDLITRRLLEIENEYLNPTYRPSKKIPEKKQELIKPYTSPKPIVLDDSLKSMRKWQGDVTRVKYSNNYEIKIRVDAGDPQLNENALKRAILKIFGVRYKGLSLDQFVYDKPTGIAIFYVNSDRIIRYQDVLNAINEIRKNRNLLLMA